MAEDWFTRCADIINMDLTGKTKPGPADFGNFPPQPSHVRVVNEPDMVAYDWDADEDGILSVEEYPDVRDETTNTDRDYELTIRFDALTELEARLLVSAVRGFILRRTTAVDPVFITDLNPQGVA